MHFNLQGIGGAFLALIFCGCSKGLWNSPVREEPPPRSLKGIQIGFESKCLKDVLPTMAAFMNGEAEESSINQNWNCFGSALGAFLENVRGANQEEIFSAREIAGFFEYFFLGDLKINDELLLQIMRIKQLAVGGRADVLTRAEILELRVFSEQMRSLSIRILPYMKVLAMNWSLTGPRTIDEETRFFEDANLALQEVVRELSQRVIKSGSEYRISWFVEFLRQFEGLRGAPVQSLPAIERSVPLIQTLKSTLTGGQKDVIESNEWRRFFLLSARGYIQFLRYYYFLKIPESRFGSYRLVYTLKSVDDLFLFLGDMVREKPDQSLTLNELTALLASLSNVFPKVRIPAALVESAMKIKQLLFGGSAEFWVPQDFERARAKVSEFQKFSNSLLNHAEYLSKDWSTNGLTWKQARSEAESSERELLAFADHLAQFMEGEFDLVHLLHLMDQIGEAFPEVKDSSFFTLRGAVPFVVSIKNIILSDANSTVSNSATQNQWQPLLRGLARVYGAYLYQHYLLEDHSLFSGEGLVSLAEVFNRMDGFFQEILAGKKDGKITQTEIQRLVSAFAASGILSQSIPFREINLFFAQVVPRLVDPSLRLAGIDSSGFGISQVTFLRQQFWNWWVSQSRVSQIYQSIPKGSGLWKRQLMERLNVSPFTHRSQELAYLMKTTQVAALDARGRIYFGGSEIPITFEAASRANLLKSLVQLIFNSYAGDLQTVNVLSSNGGLTQEQVTTLYMEVAPLLAGLGLTGPVDLKFPGKRFLEANLFTSSGDGNKLLSFAESYDLASLIYSGLGIDSEFKEILEKSCPLKVDVIRSFSTVQLDCLTKVFFDHVSRVYASAPLLVAELADLPPEQKIKAFQTLLFAAGVPDPLPADGIRYIELGLVPYVIQYIENMMRRFDTNHDGHITRVEGDQAYPIFRELILSFKSVGKSEMRAEAGFAYILRHRRLPKGVPESLSFLWWERRPSIWWYDVQRVQLAEIFSFLRKQTLN